MVEAPKESIFNSSRGLSRKNRVYVFHQFLCEVYGEGWWKAGDLVLDGAGGKGDLSWLLTNVNGLDSIVADPRLVTAKEANHLLRSIDYLRKNPDVARERAVPGLPTYQPLAALLPRIPKDVKRPRHLRIFVDDDLVEAVRHYKATKCMISWKGYWEKAVKQVSSNEETKETSMEEEFQIVDAECALRDVFLKLRLIVGFHPDQATEALMDLAQVLQINFAIVPCCIFPSEFPRRTNPEDGSRVRTYTDFLTYLKHKVPHAKEALLDFVFTDTSRNRVLYTTPPTIQLEQNE